MRSHYLILTISPPQLFGLAPGSAYSCRLEPPNPMLEDVGRNHLADTHYIQNGKRVSTCQNLCIQSTPYYTDRVLVHSVTMLLQITSHARRQNHSRSPDTSTDTTEREPAPLKVLCMVIESSKDSWDTRTHGHMFLCCMEFASVDGGDGPYRPALLQTRAVFLPE